MNLSEPLEGLTSLVAAAVLRALARSDEGFSGRQVHRLVGVGSTSSVHRSLTSLVETGLVLAEVRSPAIVYRPNRSHVLWPAVESALAARDRVFESIRGFCAAKVPDDVPLSVILYGSVARRDSTSDSDIDLLLVYPDGTYGEWLAGFAYELARYAERITGNAVQTVSIAHREVIDRRREGDAFIQNVYRDALTLAGPELELEESRRSA
jgi:predicted nucleotidyltransferase